MKVILNQHVNDGAVSMRHSSGFTVKHTDSQIRQKNTGNGCSNEDLYNALMSFKKRLYNFFINNKQPKKIDTVA